MNAESNSQSDTSNLARDAVFLARGGAVTFLGGAGAYALGFLFNVLVARKIGADAYGLYVLGLTVISIAATFSILGLARGSQRFIALYLTDEDDSRVRGTIIMALALMYGAGIVTAIGLILLAPMIARDIFGDARLTWVIRVLSVSVPFLSAMDTLGKMTQGFRVMRYKVYFEDLLQSGMRIVIGLVLLTAGWQLNAVLMAQVVPAIVGTMLLTWALYRTYPFIRAESPAIFEARTLLRFSVPLHISHVTRFMQGRTELLVLGALGATQAAGIYNISMRVSFLGAMLINAFIAIASPMITNLHRQGDISQLDAVFKVITKWLIIVNVPLTLWIMVLAEPLLQIFGREFAAGAAALSILAVARMIDSATGIGGAMINMVGRSEVSAFNAFLSVIFSLVFALVLIPPFGLVGAAVAALLGITTINAIRLAQIYRWFGIHPASRQMWKPFVAGAAATVLVVLIELFVSFGSPVAQVLVVTSVLWGSYLLLLIMFGLDETDTAVIEAVRARVRSAGWDRAIARLRWGFAGRRAP